MWVWSLLACGSPEPPTPAPEVSAEQAEPAPVVAAPVDHPAEPDADGFAPVPFTAERIREAMPVGLVIQWRRQLKTRTQETTWTVTGNTAEALTLVATPPEETQVTPWEELVDHARFPAAQTMIARDVPIDTGFGTVKTERYTVTEGDKVKTYWFSAAHPGPPLKHTVLNGGRQVFRMEQTARE